MMREGMMNTKRLAETGRLLLGIASGVRGRQTAVSDSESPTELARDGEATRFGTYVGSASTGLVSVNPV